MANDARDRTTYKKAYNQANKAKIAAYNKAYRQANPDKVAAINKAWNEANKEKTAITKKIWNKANLDKARIVTAKQKALHPEKSAARKAVYHRLRSDPTFRKPCEMCQNSKSQAHHWKGYEQKYWLDVNWLCRKHHNEAHKAQDGPNS